MKARSSTRSLGRVERYWRSSRPSVVRDDVKGRREDHQKEANSNAEEIANAVEEKTGRRVSARTMRQAQRQLHYYPVHVSVKLALADAHKAARLAWCREHVRDSVKSLVFMDEMGVWIDYHKQQYGIKPGEPRPIKELDSVKARLNVWGDMVQRQVLPPRNKRQFQHDEVRGGA